MPKYKLPWSILMFMHEYLYMYNNAFDEPKTSIYHTAPFTRNKIVLY